MHFKCIRWPKWEIKNLKILLKFMICLVSLNIIILLQRPLFISLQITLCSQDLIVVTWQKNVLAFTINCKHVFLQFFVSNYQVEIFFTIWAIKALIKVPTNENYFFTYSRDITSKNSWKIPFKFSLFLDMFIQIQKVSGKVWSLWFDLSLSYPLRNKFKKRKEPLRFLKNIFYKLMNIFKLCWVTCDFFFDYYCNNIHIATKLKMEQLSIP